MRLINGNTWRSAPASLRERYQFHLLQSRHVNPNVFSDLAAPVFVRELNRLHLTEDQPEADVLVRRWCSLSMHGLWNLNWVVAHNRNNYREHQARVKRHCQFLSGRWASLSDTDVAASRRRTEHDTDFLNIALHIIADRQDAALQLLFPASFVDPDEVNYCFGTTILGLAVRWGTESLIQRLLEQVPTTSEQNLGVYLRIAGRRREPESYAVSVLLLEHFQDIASTRAVLFQRIFFKAIRVAQYEDRQSFPQRSDVLITRRDSKAVFDNVMQWMASKPAVPGMLAVMQECYVRLCDRWGMSGKEEDRRHLFDRGTSTLDEEPIRPRYLIPAFLYGTYYRHAATREVVRACRSWETYLFNCPCRDKLWHEDCVCVKMHSSHCTCSARLHGYCLPDYRQYESAKPGKMLANAASHGLLHWVDWLLWAGADPRNQPFEESLLFWARRGGIHNEVAGLLVRHGWELEALTTSPRPSVHSQGARHVAPYVAEHEQPGSTIEFEVWAAGSELHPLWSAISKPYDSKFWEAE
jgi:hypothetical protein